MKPALESVNADYLATRLRGRHAAAQADAEKRKKTAPREQVQHFLADIDSIRSQLDTVFGALYSCFINRILLQNVTLLLRLRLNPRRLPHLAPLLAECPGAANVPPDSMLQAPSATALAGLLPAGLFRQGVIPHLKAFDEHRNLFTTETALDAVFYAHLRIACKRLPADFAPALLNLADLEMGAHNLLLLLRNQSLYHLPPDELASLFLKTQSALTPERLSVLARLTERDALAAAAPTPYREALRGKGNATLPELEDALWSLVETRACRLFRQTSDPAFCLLAYPFVRYRELLRGIRQAEAFRLEAARV